MGELKILVTNDDGYLAPGIRALADALRSIAQVEIIGPEQNSSGMSSCLTIKRPLQVFEAEEGVRFITGTPADSVYIAVNGVLNYRPDLVVSGINNGANMGNDTIYSGTVGAAIMGNMLGIPAIAFSLVQTGWNYLDTAAQVACDLVRELQAKKDIGTQYSPPWLLNVNVPNVAYKDLKGREITRLGYRNIGDEAIRTQNPYGEEIYWLGAYGGVRDAEQGTDFHAIGQSKVSITPLRPNFTNEHTLDEWKSVL